MLVGGLCGGIPLAASIAAKKLGFTIESHLFYPILGVFPAVIGGLGPDIDMPNSKSGRAVRNFLRIAITACGILVLLLAVYLGFAEKGKRVVNILIPLGIFFALICVGKLLITIAKHRRETHSGLALLIILLPNFYIVRYAPVNLLTNILLSVWMGFCIGWVSHLLADTFNRKGVPWLYPLNHKQYHIAHVLTGSKQEESFKVLSIIAFLILYLLIMTGGIYF